MTAHNRTCFPLPRCCQLRVAVPVFLGCGVSLLQVWIPDRQDVWRLARLGRMTKDFATVTIPGIYDESFEVPREHTRAWDPSHSLYLEVRACVCRAVCGNYVLPFFCSFGGELLCFRFGL